MTSSLSLVQLRETIRLKWTFALSRPTDREGCLAIFDSNTPHFFAPAERPGFERFLDNPQCTYFVMEHESELIGCGGFDIARGATPELVWGMVHAAHHGQGLGRYLLLFRLREIGRAGNFATVEVATSQMASGFFLKQGFRLGEIVPDGWAPGYDRVQMTKKLAVCE